MHEFGRRSLLSLVVAAALALAPGPAYAAGAEAFVKERHAELVDLLGKDGDSNERKVEAVFDAMLDYDTLAKGSLGAYWDERTDAERAEFKELLKRLVQRAYRKNLKKTLDYDVDYQGETQAKDGQLVKTVAKNKRNKREEPLSVDYLLHRIGGKWKVFDIVTAGSSLLDNYRNQFRRIIKKYDYQELIRRMKRKADED
jgi:phospholipid transport system substrate-binding protein